MMNACAVNVPGNVRTPSVAMPSAASRSRYARAVVAERGHDHRLAAQRLQVVGDVAGAAAPLAAHLADLERHRQHVRLVGQDVPREAVGKHHDGVVARASRRSSVRMDGVRRWRVRRAGGRAKSTAAPTACVRTVRSYAVTPSQAPLISRPISRTTNCWRRETGSVSGTPFSSTSQCASPSSLDAPLEAADAVARDEAVAVDAHEARRRTPPRAASATPRAGTRAAAVRIVMYLSSALR